MKKSMSKIWLNVPAFLLYLLISRKHSNRTVLAILNTVGRHFLLVEHSHEQEEHFTNRGSYIYITILSNTWLHDDASLHFSDTLYPSTLWSGVNLNLFIKMWYVRLREVFSFSLLCTGARVNILSTSPSWLQKSFAVSATSIHSTHCSPSAHSNTGFSHQLPSTCFFPVGSVSSKYSHLPAPGFWLLLAMSGKYVIKSVCHKSINSTQFCPGTTIT